MRIEIIMLINLHQPCSRIVWVARVDHAVAAAPLTFGAGLAAQFVARSPVVDSVVDSSAAGAAAGPRHRQQSCLGRSNYCLSIGAPLWLHAFWNSQWTADFGRVGSVHYFADSSGFACYRGCSLSWRSAAERARAVHPREPTGRSRCRPEAGC